MNPRPFAAALAAACLAGACGAESADDPATDAGAYEVDALSRKPELTDRDEVNSTMERLYPRALQDAGIGGTVHTRFVVAPDGSVEPGTAAVLESERPELSEASLELIESFRFRPGQYQGENVRVSVEMPITWKAAG